jgi:tRNA A37 threonylcarbamoyladenosine dehydratase
MKNQFDRSAMLIGHEGIEVLAKKSVAVFGIGGVGSFCAEALARAGVGSITVIDSDVVDITNINRQLIALHSTVGMDKVQVMKRRIEDINPNAKVTAIKDFYNAETAPKFDLSQYDYVIDAIDTVAGKIQIIEQAKAAGVPIICSMGAGNKLDPTKFEVADISKTSVCPLARVMRIECRKRGFSHYRVVWSDEVPLTPGASDEEPSPGRRAIPASTAFVPPAAGILMARTCVMDLLSK